VVHNDADSRYELLAGDTTLGVAEYRLLDTAGGQIADFHHTVIDPPHRDRGYGERLVRGALDDARARNLRVRPTCWYVDQFLIEHPAYQDLRA